MADLPPPYSPPGTAPALTSEIVLSALAARASSPPPPSYESVRHGRAPSTASLSTSPVSASLLTHLAGLRLQKSAPASVGVVDEKDILATLFRMFPWRRSWGALPTTLDAALRESCLMAHEGLVRALLRQGAPIPFTDRHRATKQRQGCALHAALRGAAPQLAEVLLDTFWQRAYQQTIGAVDTNRLDAATAALAAEAADAQTRTLLDARDQLDRTPLHMAAEAGATEAAWLLLRRGAELDTTDRYGRTPLHMAARYGRTETADLLLGQGARYEQLMARAPQWTEGDAQRLAEQGNYEFISNFMRERLNALGGSLLANMSITPPPAPSDDDLARSLYTLRGPAAASTGPSYVHGSLQRSVRPNPEPFPLGLPAPRPPPLQHNPNTPRTPAHSALYSDEYRVWRAGLDILQAENRAQRERNRQAEIPEGMLP